jgi:rhodanese-related sulfurtransferase
MSTAVTEIPAADSGTVQAHFERKLTIETDCWDVNDAMTKDADFVLLDVRNRTSYARGHVPGAVNLPHGRITESTMATYPSGTMFVVYCAGPHCNGADRAGLSLAKLGRPVKVMIGGVTGWLDEGFSLEGPP